MALTKLVGNSSINYLILYNNNPLKQKQMLVTKAQQEAILNKYIKEKHTTDECIGFVDGINATLDLVNKLLTH